ncbi:regulator [Streptacidiphilus sp. PB12-B1b]|uniref:ATP-binding protein n=1 Tax=Streptacidiphilus sp. PB12-B1b TaxID=2705012 RepID=UPI0015F94625|nr:regulator [Streptacidiphilus sp. PB12-B1b]QMU76413.1 regulator [Streptacidiphilus sp. PB12-B1b]
MIDRATRSVGNLPSPTTELVGRAGELAETARLLTESRLVTVVGPGGVGKSRLALRAAALAAPGHADGAWVVDCSAIRDAALLGHAVAEGLRLTDGTARPPADVLEDHLARRELLLVLDGCEQLVDACSALAARLLAAAPGLRVLATSRQPLDAAGEHLLPLLPLPADHPGADAVTLFVRRARAVVPRFRMTPANQDAVTALCLRLDGIPLALELAAGRLRALSVEQISERLDDRFRLLTGGSRSAVPRHRTLRTAIGWSHELCSPQERLLWARLSVFAGSFDLDAAEYVCSGRGLQADEVMPVLADLVAKSVVLREQAPADGAGGGIGTAGREEGYDGGYRLLDTLREYGAGWLHASGEEQRLRRLHRDWYVGLAAWGEIEWFSPRQALTSGRTHRAHANLRAAMDFCLGEPGEEQLALHLAGSLWYYWVGCGHLGEGRHWLELALAAGPEPTEARAKALWVTGYVATLQGDLLRARPVLEECRRQALATGDDRALAYAVHRQGCAALIGDELPRAAELFQEALWHYEKLGELNSNVLMAMFELGLALLFQGEQAQGEGWMARVLAQCELHGEQWAYTYGLFAAAYAAWLSGDLETARERARECVRLNHVFRDLVGTVLGVEVLALLATEPGPDGSPGDLREARLLQGAAHTIWGRVGIPLFGSRSFNAAHAECESRVLAGLSGAEAAESFRQGTLLELEAAVRRALDGPERTAPPTAVRLPGARRR